MIKHLLNFHNKPKTSFHGLWLLLGAVGFGYFMGRKKRFKLVHKKEDYDKDNSSNQRQGWYGIVDKEMSKEFREDIKHTEDSNIREVEVKQKIMNGFPTETILKNR